MFSTFAQCSWPISVYGHHEPYFKRGYSCKTRRLMRMVEAIIPIAVTVDMELTKQKCPTKPAR